VLPVYLGCLALGGVLILASLLLGGVAHELGSDADAHLDLEAGGEPGLDLDGDGIPEVDVDADADVDMDVEADAELDASADLDGGGSDLAGHLGALQHEAAEAGGAWLPFLSLRFWTFSLATFGATGALLDLFDFPSLVSAPASALTGAATGFAVAWAFHRLKTERVSGDTGLRSLTGREGRLLLSVGPDKLGKVRVATGGGDVDLPARTQDGRPIPVRETVLVVDVKDGVAQVTSLPAGAPTRRT